MCHTTVSAKHGAKDNYCNFASFNMVVNTKTKIIQMVQNVSNVILENEYKPTMIF